MFHLICRDRLGVWSKNSRGCGKTMECRIISEKAGSGRTTVSSQGSNLGKIVFGWKYNTLLTWQSDFTLLQSGQNWTASRGFLQNTKILLWENMAMDSWKLNFWLSAWMQKNLLLTICSDITGTPYFGDRVKDPRQRSTKWFVFSSFTIEGGSDKDCDHICGNDWGWQGDASFGFSACSKKIKSPREAMIVKTPNNKTI